MSISKFIQRGITLLFIISCQLNLFSQVPDFLPKESLVAWYPFNGNANDESGNGLNGTVNNAILTTDRFGDENSAYSFTENQEIIIPNTENQNLYPLSISLWYNIDSLTADNGNIFSKYLPAAWNGYLIHTIRAEKVVPWYIRNSSNRVLGLYGEEPFSQSGVITGTWYHFVYTTDNDGGKIYVNGELIDTHSWTGEYGACNNSQIWKIGGLYTDWFHGEIDDIGIWNKALTDQEVLDIYNGYNTSSKCSLNGSLNEGLIAYYPFCGNANDESGNGFDGTVNGAELAPDRFGNSNSAYSFNNNDISVNILNSLFNSDYTISVWVFLDSLNSNTAYPTFITQENSYLTFQCENDTNSGYPKANFYYLNYFNLPGQQIEEGHVQANLSSNKWMNLVLVNTSGINHLYINGIFKAKSNTASTIQGKGDGNYLKFGNGDELPQELFIGELDDIGIWNRALSEQEVQSLYNNNGETSLQIVCPDDIYVDCIYDIPMPDTSLIQVSGGCSNKKIELVGDISDYSLCPETITRTYRVIDGCGDTAICSQKIIIEDIVPPILACVPVITVSCESEIPTPFTTLDEFLNAGGLAIDNCKIENSFLLVQDESKINSVLRTYSVSDMCGNTATCTQEILIQDTIPPDFTIPADINIYKDENCNFNAGIEITGDITNKSDNCSLNLQSMFTDEIEVEDSGNEIISRIWSVSDDSGNQTTGIQKIYIEDIVPPYIFCPSDISVNNESQIQEPFASLDGFLNNNGMVDDNCGILFSSFELFYELLDTLVTPQELKRTYLIADEAGNESVCLQKIAIENITSLYDYTSINDMNFKVYPNPTNNKVVIEINNSEKLENCFVKINNAVGQEIFSDRVNQTPLVLEGISWGGNGFYFVNIINADGVIVYSSKIVLHK